MSWIYPYPEVAIGDQVYFWPGKRRLESADSLPEIAFVTALESFGVRLARIPDGQNQLTVIDDAIRHRTDPQARNMIEGDPVYQGVWDTTPWHVSPSQRRGLAVLLTIFGVEIGQYLDDLDQPKPNKPKAAPKTALTGAAA